MILTWGGPICKLTYMIECRRFANGAAPSQKRGFGPKLVMCRGLLPLILVILNALSWQIVFLIERYTPTLKIAQPF